MLTTEDYIAKENKPVKYWQNAVWPDETKAELLDAIIHTMFGGQKAPYTIPKTPY